MYSKEQASAVRQKFWTTFGKYMSPVPAASEEKVNWINYKTGIKGIAFKMNADNNRAIVFVELFLPDKAEQLQYFEVFAKFKKQFEKIAGKDWDMREHVVSEDGKETGRISAELNGINIFRETDWPDIISFLKKNITALDSFWNEYKPAFELMQ